MDITQAKQPDFTETVCACKVCQAMCESRPCWPTPPEAQRLIDRGYGARLMLDSWVKLDRPDILILSPAISGYEGKPAPFWPEGRCSFLTAEGLCELHDLGLKPLEGRIACHDKPDSGLHKSIAQMWDSPEAQELIEGWKKDYVEAEE